MEINRQYYGRAILKDVTYVWADDLTIEDIREDTYPHWSREDFEVFLFRFYKNRKPFLIWLHFEWCEVLK